jgi:hypothetical protein
MMMALIKNKFEAPDADKNVDDGVIDGAVKEVVDETATLSAHERLAVAAAARADEAKAEREAVEASKTASTSTAVAAKTASNIVLAAPVMGNIFAGLENAFHVDWNTFESLLANQGTFMRKGDKAKLGDSVGLELLSYQQQFVISPGTEGDADNDKVRYSDDGVTTTTGEDCKSYLEDLKEAGFDKASRSERVVLVGSLFDPGKLAEIKDQLVQISLPPTSKAQFERHKIQTDFNIGRGLSPALGATRLRMTCEVQSDAKNKRDWTVVKFAQYV